MATANDLLIEEVRRSAKAGEPWSFGTVRPNMGDAQAVIERLMERIRVFEQLAAASTTPLPCGSCAALATDNYRKNNVREETLKECLEFIERFLPMCRENTISAHWIVSEIAGRLRGDIEAGVAKGAL